MKKYLIQFNEAALTDRTYASTTDLTKPLLVTGLLDPLGWLRLSTESRDTVGLHWNTNRITLLSPRTFTILMEK